MSVEDKDKEGGAGERFQGETKRRCEESEEGRKWLEGTNFDKTSAQHGTSRLDKSGDMTIETSKQPQAITCRMNNKI
eukprot:749451-Hanusia_phi.AAC.1